MTESPVFIKAYEMMVWLMQHTAKFPKNQRFLLARRMEDAALDLHRALHRAARARDSERARRELYEADANVADLKTYDRLSMDLKLLSFPQYEYLGGMLEEIGKLIGGWLKSVSSRSTTAQAV